MEALEEPLLLMAWYSTYQIYTVKDLDFTNLIAKNK